MKKIIFISAVCGVGKSTTCEYIKNNNLLDNYAVFDIDDLVNVHEYDSGNRLYEDAIKKAVLKSNDKNVILGSCVNPVELKRLNIPNNLEINMILIYCSNEELTNRLKMRDIRRNCSNDDFINSQIEYQNYMINHIDLFELCIDNSNISVDEVSNQIIKYVKESEKRY